METLPTGINENLNETKAAPANVISQKEAVYTISKSVVGELAEGVTLKSALTKEVRAQIRAKLFEGIKDGSIKYAPTKTDAEIKKYCSSVINNWVKKDARFS